MQRFEIKPISKEAVPDALDKAVRYRLLNEPTQAESICLDILEVDPDNEKAKITLLLARTDQFPKRLAQAVNEARELLPRLQDDYKRAYYEGVIWERKAKAQHATGGPGSAHQAYDSLLRALESYDRAIARRPEGNDEAILRWNSCVRLLNRHPELEPAPEDSFQPFLE